MANLAVLPQGEIVSQDFGDFVFNDFFRFLDASEKTCATYYRALKQFSKFLKDNGIKNPTHEDIIAFKKSLLDAGRKPATVALYLASVRKLFTWCEKRGIYKNISQGIKSPKIDGGHKRDFVGATQLKKILSDMPHTTIEDKRNFAIFLLTVTAGLRTVEVVRADVADLRVQGDFMTLSIQGKGKASKADFVKIAPETYEAIQDYLKARGQVTEAEPLFTSTSNRNKNGRLTTRAVSGICKSAMRKSGFDTPRLSAHSLRHSAVTLSILAGHPLDEIQAFARHSSINTTMVYAHSVNRLTSTIEDDICKAIFDKPVKN